MNKNYIIILLFELILSSLIVSHNVQQHNTNKSPNQGVNNNNQQQNQNSQYQNIKVTSQNTQKNQVGNKNNNEQNNQKQKSNTVQDIKKPINTQQQTINQKDNAKVDNSQGIKNSTFNLTYEMLKAFAAFNNSLSSSDNVKINNTKNEPEIEKLNKETLDDQDPINEKQNWGDKIIGVSFSNILTISLDEKKYDSFNEEITEPTLMKFAFIVNHPTKTIDFSLLGPNEENKVHVYNNVIDRNFYYSEFNATIPGKYVFHLNNQRFRYKKKVTFALSLSKVNEDKAIGQKNFDILSEQFNRIDNKMNEIRLKGNIAIKKIEGHNKSISKHNRSMVIFSIVEIFTMIIILFIQGKYLINEINKL